MTGLKTLDGDSSPRPELYSCGVDWLTCFQHFGDRGDSLWHTAVSIIDQQEAAGWEKTPFRTRFTTGFGTKHIKVARHKDGTVATIGGDLARRLWSRLSGVATKVSRLDVQATVLYPQDHMLNPATVAEGCATRPQTHGRPPRIAFRGEWPRVTGVEVGSRTSLKYGRLYDKGVESALYPPGRLWRWEVEFHDEAAANAREALAGSDQDAIDAGAIALTQWRSWGASIALDFPSICIPTVQTEPTTAEATLRWLQTAVAPSVRRLVKAGRLPEVLAALDLPPG